ncbi:acyl-CoA carboxylase epsilon subunit [Streptomyces sp. NPDC002952]|uniref:acyl-CoA carboxylase epsilon subunit n=1 Tax=Streptomyces sp. NPDC002952 TaxID=3364673 RepID=UPI0036CA716F
MTSPPHPRTDGAAPNAAATSTSTRPCVRRCSGAGRARSSPVPPRARSGHLRVVKGAPEADELAAVTAVITTLLRTTPQAANSGRRTGTVPSGPTRPRLPGATGRAHRSDAPSDVVQQHSGTAMVHLKGNQATFGRRAQR